jgi:hypothetical protein
MSRIVKTDDKRFVKDLYTNAVINIDKEGYQSFMSNRQRVLRQQQLEKQVQNLQQDIGDIKQLLQQLINGKTDGKSNS